MNHILYTTLDADKPEAICDRNGHVVLNLCRICGKGEAQLVDAPCLDIGALQEQAAAWFAVVAALDKANPQWRGIRPTAMASAVRVIELAHAKIDLLKVSLNNMRPTVANPYSLADNEGADHD